MTAALDLFAGAGGWSLACERLGIEEVGVENMEAARQTRAAAGFKTHEVADVWDLDYAYLRGVYEGLITSPPCQTFSAAGKGAGRKALDQVLGLIADGTYKDKDALREAGVALGDERTALVLLPLHAAWEMRPEWIAWEQVPTVLPVWEACADELRSWGYSVWTDNLLAEQHGVPQTRKRALLGAHRDRETFPPVPTHSRYHNRSPKRLDEGVLKWVSMAEALGWGQFTMVSNYSHGGDASQRGERSSEHPPPTVTSKFDRNRVVPQGIRSLAGGGWEPVTWDADQPALTVTGAGRNVGFEFVAPSDVELKSRRDSPKWVEENGERKNRTADLPAPTLTGEAHRWDWEERGMKLCPTNLRPNAALRSMDQPAPTMAFGHETPRWVPPEEEAEYRSRLAEEVEPRVNNQSGTEFDLAWPADRPAPVIAGRDIVTMPGANANRFNGATKSRNDGIRVTVQEAGVLQSFPADFQWQGNKGEQFLQVGNAVPPLLAEAVLKTLV